MGLVGSPRDRSQHGSDSCAPWSASPGAGDVSLLASSLRPALAQRVSAEPRLRELARTTPTNGDAMLLAAAGALSHVIFGTALYLMGRRHGARRRPPRRVRVELPPGPHSRAPGHHESPRLAHHV